MSNADGCGAAEKVNSDFQKKCSITDSVMLFFQQVAGENNVNPAMLLKAPHFRGAGGGEGGG